MLQFPSMTTFTRDISVTPSDSDYLVRCGFIYLTGSVGNVAVVTAEGDTVTYTFNELNKIIFPVLVKKVKSTGTTATGVRLVFTD